MTIAPPTANSIPASAARARALVALAMMLAALVAATVLGAVPANAATQPRDFVGVTAWEPMSSTGLHRESGMPKPAWTAFSRVARYGR